MRELFHYALVMLFIEDGKAEIIEQRTIDAREWMTVRATTPEIFSIVKPDVARERSKTLRALAREVLDEEATGLVTNPFEVGCSEIPFSIHEPESGPSIIEKLTLND